MIRIPNIKPHIRKVTKPIHRLYIKTPHVEHGGFVALAASEVFHLGPLIFYVNIILLVSGTRYESLHIFHGENDA